VGLTVTGNGEGLFVETGASVVSFCVGLAVTGAGEGLFAETGASVLVTFAGLGVVGLLVLATDADAIAEGEFVCLLVELVLLNSTC